ncbi:MAG: SDR family oxidoreductase [Proteobacteria bacterium]|nr:SDR family oxidoreductase [Pseudomonadota bacterium]
MSFEIDLSARRALVTGAGQHNGRAIARELAAAGAEVSVNDIVAERAEQVSREIEESGGVARPAVFDVTDSRAAGDAIAEHAPDILVNNVGDTGAGNAPGSAPVFSTALFLESDPGDWTRLLDINLYGVMYCTHAALPKMIERGWGRVITIVSDAGRVPSRRMVAYSAAKAGAAGFSRSIAAEVGRSGVTVNCVSLGTILSEHVSAEAADQSYQRMRRDYLAPRLGRPDDAAGMVVFLASPWADWITGQTYPVNGGFSATL